MSYAGKSARVAPAKRGVARAESTALARPRDREVPIAGKRRAPRGRPVDERVEWAHVALFATGAILGLTVGAGAALLLAPQSGAETRREIGYRGRRIGHRTADAWGDLRSELRRAARRARTAISDRGTARRARRERTRELEAELDAMGV